MSRTPRIATRLACFALTGVLLASGLGRPGTILCLGADGHVAVEPASASCCTPPVETCDPDADHLHDSACSAPDDACGPCADLVILYSAPSRSRLVAHRAATPAVSSAVLNLSCVAFSRQSTSPTRLGGVSPPAPHSTSLACLRTTHLLL